MAAPEHHGARRPSRRERLHELHRRAEERRAAILTSRDRHASLDIALAATEHDRTTGGGLLAAALAFRLFLWILPATLVIVGGLGFVDPATAGDNAGSFGLGNFAATQIEQASSDAHRARWVALTVGLILLMVASVSLAKAITLAARLAWHLPPQRQSRPLRAAAVVNAVALATAFTDLATAWLRHRSAQLGLVALLLSFAIWVALWWGVSILLPHPKRLPRVQLLPGAVTFGIGVYLLHLATVLYLSRRVTSASKLYGALGGSATLLLWAYLLCRLIVASATVNATWAARVSRQLPPDAPPTDSGAAAGSGQPR